MSTMKNLELRSFFMYYICNLFDKRRNADSVSIEEKYLYMNPSRSQTLY